RKLEGYIARRNGVDAPVGPVPASIASTQHAALAEAATEVTRWIGTGGKSTLVNRVVSTSVLTLERTHHTLIRRPQCPSCGFPKSNSSICHGPMRLERRAKAHSSDGGHRAFDQGDVLAQLERHLSPITGIVGSLAPGDRAGGIHRGGSWLTPT